MFFRITNKILIAVFAIISIFFNSSAFAFTDNPPSFVEYLQEQGAFDEKEKAHAFSGNTHATREMLIRWSMNLKNIPGDVNTWQTLAKNIGAFDEWKKAEKIILKKKLTKLEALSFLFSIENISLIDGAIASETSSITDLPKDEKQKAILLTAIEKKLIYTDEDNKISPNKKITKEELAKIIAKMHKAKNATLHPQNIQTETDYDTIQTLLQKNYLYHENIDFNKINDNAFDAMLKTLNDPYSVYMPPEESENFTNYINESHPEISGYAGIGASVQVANEGGIVIGELFSNSPAFQSGIRVGDIIQRVDGKDITKMTLDEGISLIKGPENTVVQIEILRSGKNLSFEVVRKKITVENYNNISATTKDNIVWIKIRGFKTLSGDEFKDILDKNITSDTKGVIIDLRYNPGGLLESAQEMLGELLPAKYLASRLIEHGQETKHEVLGRSKYTDIPLVVFQNEYSASASEIFSASIQDYQRGTIIGNTSFGKGIAQNLFFLQRGSIKLTTAEFISPLGNTIHKKGVTPDVILNAFDDETYFQEAKKVFKK